MIKRKPEQSSLKVLKSKNRRTVLETLRLANEPLGILDVARHTSLSKMTVHKIMNYLVESGLALKAGKGEPGEDGGKRPTVFEFNPNYRFIFSVRIAETCLVTAAANLKAQILFTQTAMFARESSLAEILRLIRNQLYALAAKLSLRAENCVGVGVGCHGITDSDKGIIVTSPHFTSWGANIPIRDRIKELFPFAVPVYVDNWIRFFAYGELKRLKEPNQSFMAIGTEPEASLPGWSSKGGWFRERKDYAGK